MIILDLRYLIYEIGLVLLSHDAEKETMNKGWRDIQDVVETSVTNPCSHNVSNTFIMEFNKVGMHILYCRTQHFLIICACNRMDRIGQKQVHLLSFQLKVYFSERNKHKLGSNQVKYNT